MKIKPCRPKKLPLRKLDWEKFVDSLGRAHRKLAQYEEQIKRVPHPRSLFSLLVTREALDSLEKQPKSPTLEEVLIGQVFPEKVSNPLIQWILNDRNALVMVGECSEREKISLAFLCRLHGIIKKDAREIPSQVGRIRDRQNWIGPEGRGRKEAYFYPPAASQLAANLKNLKKYAIYREKDPLVQLSIFFAQLLIIHPFMDGNGRLARAVIPFFLFKKKLISSPLFYMSVYFKKHRLEYFERLFAITKENDWEGWIRFFLKGVIESAEQSIQKIGAIRSLYEDMLKEMGDSLDHRKKLELLFTMPIMKKEKWEQLKSDCEALEMLEVKKWIVPYKKKTMVAVRRLLTIV